MVEKRSELPYFSGARIALDAAINAISREVYHRGGHYRTLGRIKYSMEKIGIRFKESDYQMYHNYCLRYYTIYDTTRKRSIHLFIELFEKDLLPVTEHDLGEAFSFFSKKCEDSHTDPNFTGQNQSPESFPQFLVCRDILFLIQDFEKIYHLIEKTGTISNYVLILATFSKIIEEEKNAYLSVIYEQDREKIASFAPEIADIIRKRLGSSPGWESVLYELTRIVRKFNLASPDQKISQNAIFFLGSAVVSYFTSFAVPAEIQSTLQKYFAESELDEFESLLNNTPYLPDNDTDSDLSNQVIFDALISISRREKDQRYHVPVSDPEFLKIAGIPTVISSSVVSRNPPGITPSRQSFSQYPSKSRENYFSRFDIDVGDTVKSLVVLPEKRNNHPYNVYMKPGMPQPSFIIMGFIILILFAVTMAAVSGMWSPVKILGNTSTGIIGNLSDPLRAASGIAGSVSSPSGLLSPSQPAKNNSVAQQPTVKGTPVVVTPTTPARMTSSDINKNFMRIAFGPDNTRILKSAENRITVAMTGNFYDADIATVEQFKDQFNNYSYTNQFVTEIKFEDKASIVMVFLPESSMINIVNLPGTVTSRNSKTGSINFMHMTIKNNFVSKDVLYINSDYKGEERKHWILRGLLSELGFVGETDDYVDSIFYSGSDTTGRLTDSDWKVVELMYGQKITPGMTFDRVKSLLLV